MSTRAQVRLHVHKTSAPHSSLTLCESPGAIPQVAQVLPGYGEPSAGTIVATAQVRVYFRCPPPPCQASPGRAATAPHTL